MIQAGIETRLILCQSDISPGSHRHSLRNFLQIRYRQPRVYIYRQPRVYIYIYIYIYGKKWKSASMKMNATFLRNENWNWKETELWCTRKKLGLFNQRQRHVSIDTAKKLFYLFVQLSNARPCVSWPISSLQLLSIMCISSSGLCNTTMHCSREAISFLSFRGSNFDIFFVWSLTMYRDGKKKKKKKTQKNRRPSNDDFIQRNIRQHKIFRFLRFHQ